MFSLTHIKNSNSYVVCKKGSIGKKGNLLYKSKDKKVLNTLKNNLIKNVPKIILERVDIFNISTRNKLLEKNDKEQDILEKRNETLLEETLNNDIVFMSDEYHLGNPTTTSIHPSNESIIQQNTDVNTSKDEENTNNVSTSNKLLEKNYKENDILEKNYEAILEEALNNDIVFMSDEYYLGNPTISSIHPSNESFIQQNSDVNTSKDEENTNKDEYYSEKPTTSSIHPSNKHIILQNTDGNTSKDEENTNIVKLRRGEQRKHYCCYCHKFVFKISRHYLSVHKNENEVKDIAVLPKKSPIRLKLLDNLRKQGDFIYNRTKTPNMSYIVCKQSKNGKIRDKDICCPHCKGYYSKYSLRNHVRYCRPDKYCSKRRTNIQPEARKMDMTLHDKASEDLRIKIFPYLREDNITDVIRFDEAIIQYGNHLCRKYTSEHHSAQIRSHLRGFGKIMIAVKETNPLIQNLSELLEARNIYIIINAINKIAGLDEASGVYRAPATATTLGTELKRLCKLLQMEYIKNDDKENLEKMKNLLLVFEMEFNVTINKIGAASQKVFRRRKKIILPKTETIAKFREYLECKMEHYIAQLEKGFTKLNWVKLTEYTLVHLAVFNRKRPGETQRILIDDYKNFEIMEEDEIRPSDELYKEQFKKWARIRFTGKLGNDNALLIHRDIGFKALNLILKFRVQAGVNPANRYVFGEPSQIHSQQTFKACYLIRKISNESQIPNHELMRTRLLRQHLATEAANINIDTRLENRVSDFMSHQKSVHDVHYVMNKKKDDIMKISTLLEDFSSIKSTKELEQMDISEDPQHKDRDSFQDEDYHHSSTSEDDSELSQAELDLILGKPKKRRSWNTEEIECVKRAFGAAISENTQIDKTKLRLFYQKNQKILKHRSPHLIHQWIRGEQIRHQNKIKGLKLQRERWNALQKKAIDPTIKNHFKENTYPSIAECTYLKEKNNILENKSPGAIKSYIYNSLKNRRSI